MHQLFDVSDDEKRTVRRAFNSFLEIDLLQTEFHFPDKGFRMKECEDEITVSIKTDKNIIPALYAKCEICIGSEELLAFPYVRLEAIACPFDEWGCCLHLIIEVKNPEFYKQIKEEGKILVRKQYHTYLKSTAWIEFRGRVFNTRGFHCELCHGKRNLQLHHLTYERLGAELESDVMILCQKCHENAHKN